MAAYGGLRGLVIVWGFNLAVDQTLFPWRLEILSKIVCFDGEEKD